MIDELNRQLPRLRKAGALPFKNEMNWALDPLYDYDAMLRKSNSAAGTGAERDTAAETEGGEGAAEKKKKGTASRKSSEL